MPPLVRLVPIPLLSVLALLLSVHGLMIICLTLANACCWARAAPPVALGLVRVAVVLGKTG